MPSNVYQPTCLQLDTIYVFDRPLNKCIVSVFNPSPALLHYMFVDCVLKCPYFKCTKRYISIVCVLYFQNTHISCAPRSVFFLYFCHLSSKMAAVSTHEFDSSKDIFQNRSSMPVSVKCNVNVFLCVCVKIRHQCLHL